MHRESDAAIPVIVVDLFRKFNERRSLKRRDYEKIVLPIPAFSFTIQVDILEGDDGGAVCKIGKYESSEPANICRSAGFPIWRWMPRLVCRKVGYAKKTKVTERYFIEDETASQMGAKAAYAALEAAGLAFADIDCLVCASGTMEQPIPCTAALIQEAMGQQQSGVPAFDINSTCLGFVAGLDVMSYMVAAGRYRHGCWSRPRSPRRGCTSGIRRARRCSATERRRS
ncbi:MAG: beta-ketoacyl-ACP synthase [Paenibacillus sp.]|jgi:hypothetical protein|nr:beta-ketoacyl-ACP synthase [Paenibacillus sp.]